MHFNHQMYTMMPKVTCLNPILTKFEWHSFERSFETKSVLHRFPTHLKRGLHLSIIPPPLTTKRWPLDHFWSLCCYPSLCCKRLAEVHYSPAEQLWGQHAPFQQSQCFLWNKDKTTISIYHENIAAKNHCKHRQWFIGKKGMFRNF